MIVSALEAWYRRSRSRIADQARRDKFVRTLWPSFEAIALPVLFVAVTYLFHAEDAFWAHARFPWTWLAPVTIALRYGFILGSLSTFTLLLLWLGAPWLGLVPGPQTFPREYFLGGLILVLIAGEFADVWNLRLRRSMASSRYLDERLTALTRNHFLLRLSHERIENELLTRPATLRETLLNLRTIARASANEASSLPGGKEFLQLLAQSCQIEVASLHAIERGVFKSKPVATLGQPRKLETRNAMLNECLAVGELVHLLSAEQAAAQQATPNAPLPSVGIADEEPYLVCAPLTSATGERIGVLTVERMSFFALNPDVLRLLSVLVGYYADGVASVSAIAPVRDVVPNCHNEFALELTRLTYVRAEVGLDSALVALEFPHPVEMDEERRLLAKDLFERARRLPRQIDIVWATSSDDRDVLLILLPLAGRAGTEGFLARVEAIFQAQFGINLESEHAFAHTALLSEAEPAQQLRDMLIRCHLNGELRSIELRDDQLAMPETGSASMSGNDAGSPSPTLASAASSTSGTTDAVSIATTAIESNDRPADDKL